MTVLHPLLATAACKITTQKYSREYFTRQPAMVERDKMAGYIEKEKMYHKQNRNT